MLKPIKQGSGGLTIPARLGDEGQQDRQTPGARAAHSLPLEMLTELLGPGQLDHGDEPFAFFAQWRGQLFFLMLGKAPVVW